MFLAHRREIALKGREVLRGAEFYVEEALRDLPDGPPCAANALLAGDDTFRREFHRLNGMELTIALMKSSHPVEVYLAAAKILHVLLATTTCAISSEDLVLVVESALAWSSRESDELTHELLCVCYALGCKGASLSLDLAPLLRDPVPLRIKTRAATVMMVSSSSSLGDEDLLLRLLVVQLQRYLVVGEDSAKKDLLPILGALVNTPSITEKKIFPHPPLDREDSIHPEKSPRYSLRRLLMELQTDLDPSLKRFANEILFKACGKDPSVFKKRCGVGNTISFLM